MTCLPSFSEEGWDIGRPEVLSGGSSGKYVQPWVYQSRQKLLRMHQPQLQLLPIQMTLILPTVIQMYPQMRRRKTALTAILPLIGIRIMLVRVMRQARMSRPQFFTLTCTFGFRCHKVIELKIGLHNVLLVVISAPNVQSLHGGSRGSLESY